MEPPADPEAWTDEQWIAWLEATDAEPASEVDEPSRATRRAASLLGRAMLGLEEALFGPRHDDEIVIVAGADEPTETDGLEVHLDPDEPARSWARLDPTRRRLPQNGPPPDGQRLSE